MSDKKLGKYGPNTLVTIVANTAEHSFDIGEVVRITCNDQSGNGYDYKAEYLDGSDYWWLNEEDVKVYIPKAWTVDMGEGWVYHVTKEHRECHGVLRPYTYRWTHPEDGDVAYGMTASYAESQYGIHGKLGKHGKGE